MNQALPERDLEEILVASESAFAALRGTSVLITGGTGFVGSWMSESLLHANRRLSLGARLTMLVRDPVRLAAPFARALAEGRLNIVTGDVRTFAPSERPDAIVNAATPTTGHALDPSDLIGTIAAGAGHVLEIASRAGAIPVLFTSSGAIYGRQPPGLERIPETFASAYDPLDTRYAYHEAKRFAEALHAAAAARPGPLPKIARLFAFAGPRLPLDAHFAVGNFIRDAMNGGPVAVGGDGSPVRSYLYASDMATWLWHILVRGRPARAYNVGSERAFSIAEIAHLVARESRLHSGAVTIAQIPGGGPPERYIPDTTRARTELGRTESVTFEEAVRRTVAWHAAP